MSLTISIPDDFADVLGCSPEKRQQRAREALALELYPEDRISLRQMGELAGFGDDYWAAENLRVLPKAPLNYSSDDVEADRLAAQQLDPLACEVLRDKLEESSVQGVTPWMKYFGSLKAYSAELRRIDTEIERVDPDARK